MPRPPQQSTNFIQRTAHLVKELLVHPTAFRLHIEESDRVLFARLFACLTLVARVLLRGEAVRCLINAGIYDVRAPRKNGENIQPFALVLGAPFLKGAFFSL